MKLCSALLAALLAAALMSASAAPTEVCVLSITANKPASLDGAALSSLHAALTEITKGDVVIGADPERGHTAAAVYVDNAPLATTAALCRALPKALPGKLPSSIFGKGVSVSATMQPLLPSTLTKASTWSCMANCKPCKNITCCKNRGGCCYSWAKWLGCNTVKLSNGWKCKCPI